MGRRAQARNLRDARKRPACKNLLEPLKWQAGSSQLASRSGSMLLLPNPLGSCCPTCRTALDQPVRALSSLTTGSHYKRSARSDQHVASWQVLTPVRRLRTPTCMAVMGMRDVRIRPNRIKLQLCGLYIAAVTQRLGGPIASVRPTLAGTLASELHEWSSP